jgi:hypothetical protein
MRFAPPEPYRAPSWLPGGHAQTIWPWFVSQSAVRWPALVSLKYAS